MRFAESAARQTADLQRYEADVQRKQAEENLRQARAAVDESFTLISESKLLEVPGLHLLRKELLESSLRFYEGFAQKHSDDPRGMTDVAVTYLRIAQINAAIDQNDEATVAVKHALDMIDQLRREYPDDQVSPVRLAGFCTERRWIQRGTAVPRDPLAAFQTLLRLQRLWEQLAQEHPNTIGFQSDLSAIHGAIGSTLHWSGRAKQATQLWGHFRCTLRCLAVDLFEIGGRLSRCHQVSRTLRPLSSISGLVDTVCTSTR